MLNANPYLLFFFIIFFLLTILLIAATPSSKGVLIVVSTSTPALEVAFKGDVDERTKRAVEGTSSENEVTYEDEPIKDDIEAAHTTVEKIVNEVRNIPLEVVLSVQFVSFIKCASYCLSS